MIDLEYKMTTVDLNMTGYRDDPFVLAKDVIQVFYVMDMSTKPKRKLQTNDVPSETVPKRHIVLPGKQKVMGVEDINDEEDYDQLQDAPPFSVHVDTSTLLANEDAPYLRSVHNKGRIVKMNCNSKKR